MLQIPCLATLLISEMPTNEQAYGKYEVEDFLADGLIHLYSENRDNHIDRYLQVLKMRTSIHTQDPFPLVIEQGEFRIFTG